MKKIQKILMVFVLFIGLNVVSNAEVYEIPLDDIYNNETFQNENIEINLTSSGEHSSYEWYDHSPYFDNIASGSVLDFDNSLFKIDNYTSNYSFQDDVLKLIVLSDTEFRIVLPNNVDNINKAFKGPYKNFEIVENTSSVTDTGGTGDTGGAGTIDTMPEDTDVSFLGSNVDIGGIMDPIINMLPLLLPILIGFIGIRKAIAFLMGVLKKA